MDIASVTQQVEEVSEGYAAKFGLERNPSWFMLKLHEEVGELTQAFMAVTGQARPKGKTDAEIAAEFRAEVADVFCQVLLLANSFDVDLEAEVKAKWLSWRNVS